MKLWIVGQVKEYPSWEFQGVFDSREKALSICKDYTWFVAPAELNKALPDDTVLWDDLEYQSDKSLS